ncbi:3-hydroxy-3-methylglutaryl-coenzyme A (HMG-CoA) reductase isozyme, partial [Coemansia sp. RSA 2673]
MQALGYSINAVLLTEALPFLIICVGFDKSLTLTRSVLLAAYSTAGRARGPSQPAADGDSAGAATVTPGQIQEQIERGVDKCAGGLAKDYLFEIGILAIGVCSGVGQLQEVCLISSFILMFDGVFMFTFYSAVLTLKLDLIRVRSTRSSAQAGAGAAGGVELTRQFPMLDGVAGPVIAVISGLYPFTAGAGSSLAQLRVRILPVASWHSSAAAAAVSMESSSIVIALLSAGVVLSLGVNVYLVLFGSV